MEIRWRTLPFIAALLTVLAALVALDMAVRDSYGPAALHEWASQDFLAHERDDHGHMISQVYELQDDPPPADRQAIYVIGGSTVREGFLPDVAIRRLIEADAGKAPFWTTLASFDQTLAETWRVALNLPLHDGDLVVISVNPRRLGILEERLKMENRVSRLSLLPMPETGRLEAAGLTGSTFTLESVSALFRHRLYIQNWYTSRLPGAAKTAWAGISAGEFGSVSLADALQLRPRNVRRYVRYAYGNLPLPAAEKTRIAAEVRRLRVPQYFEQADFNERYLRELIRALQDRGAKVALLQLPRSQQSVDAYDEVWDDFEARLKRISDDTGAGRVDLRDVRFAEDEYFDLEHLTRSGRPVLTRRAVEAVLEVAGAS